MQLIEEQIGSVLVVKPLEKRLDAFVAADFKERMASSIRGGKEWILLDLQEVEFIDSSGLGAIVASLKMLSGNGDLMIAGATNTVSGLFKLTRMDRVFQIFADREQALAAMKAKLSQSR